MSILPHHPNKPFHFLPRPDRYPSPLTRFLINSCANDVVAAEFLEIILFVIRQGLKY